MMLAYAYRARNRRGLVVEGLIYARSEAAATYRLARVLRMQPLRVMLAVRATVAVLWRPLPAAEDLAVFYSTLGTRLEHGHGLDQGLTDALEFVVDPRLRHSIALAAEELDEGAALAGALRRAGFPERDCALLEGMADSGRVPEVLCNLGREIDRRERLRGALNALLRMPLAVTAVMYVGLYLALVAFLPAMQRFYSALGNVHPPALAALLYDFATAFRANVAIATAIYLALPLAALVLARTPLAARLLDAIPMRRRLAERADMSALWTGFGMLYDAGIHVEDACTLVARAAARPASSAAFRALGRHLRAGVSLVNAVARARFPAYVVGGVQAAESSGDVVGGIERMASRLTMDVEALTRRCEHSVRLVAYTVLAVCVAGFFLLSYYPILSTTLSLV